ncbi:MAG: hypothetical protein ABIU96_09505 [Rhodanobacter sp.]
MATSYTAPRKRTPYHGRSLMIATVTALDNADERGSASVEMLASTVADSRASSVCKPALTRRHALHKTFAGCCPNRHHGRPDMRWPAQRLPIDATGCSRDQRT